MMTGRTGCQPVDALHPSGHDFAFAAQGAVLLAHRGESLPAVPATDSTADQVLARLGEITREVTSHRTRRGRPTRPVVCGVIPFDPAEPADLFIAEQPVWSPRPHPTGPVAPAQELLAGPVDPDLEYREAVAEALDRMDRGAAQHLVLARALDLPHGIDAAQVWDQLLGRSPGSYAYSVRPRDGDPFVGVGPELMAEVRPTGFTCHLLTGSAPRRLTVAGDATAQETLLRTPSALRQHQHVLDHAQRALRGHAASMVVPGRPCVMGTDATWHLATRITGRLHRGVSALHAARTLHRGPAVGGTPGRAALSLIRELEPCRRGPYAGLVGWTDAAGHGQWVPVLRCALLTERRARLYAGAELGPGTTVDTTEKEIAVTLDTLRAAVSAAQEPGAAAMVGAAVASVGDAA